MAYPVIAGPYGFEPVNLIGGRPFAGSTRMFPIANGYSTSIFNGDIVKLASDGTIQKDTGTSTATPVGIFLGCSYTNPATNQRLNYQYYAANTTSPFSNQGDIIAYVTDDPQLVFKSAVVSTTTNIGQVGQWAVGLNAAIVQNTGSTSTGDSANAVNGFATTSTLPLRVIQLVPDTAVNLNLSASVTSGSPSMTVTLPQVSQQAQLAIGQSVYGTGIAAGTRITNIVGTTVTLSANATATASGVYQFQGASEVLLTYNFGTHAYFNATGV